MSKNGPKYTDNVNDNSKNGDNNIDNSGSIVSCDGGDVGVYGQEQQRVICVGS